MQSYRKRLAVQKQHVVHKSETEIKNTSFRNQKDETKIYILKAIAMYKAVMKQIEPLSDEEKLCCDEILKYTIDLETLERGTFEESKEVISKYGRCIS